MRLAVSLVLLMLALPASGCVPRASTPPVSETTTDDIPSMDPIDARSRIASSFPLEVPVPEGEIIEGKAQGADAWDYEIALEAGQGSVVSWYRRTFLSRSWLIVEDKTEESDDGSLVNRITLRKGAAESRVVIEPDGTGSRAFVVLGIGAPVLVTQ